MEAEKYRAWVYYKQGLGEQRYASARETLGSAGWQRSVGGVSPYLAIRARSGEGRAEVDSLAERLELFELPSARGCTYVLPSDHFALGLALCRRGGPPADVVIARKLGVSDGEVAALMEAVVGALAGMASTPTDLRAQLGDRVRNLGEEGKRKGLATTLPLALRLLQSAGRIRRRPANGRLDTQRYAYELWNPPVADLPAGQEALTECARLFFAWAGAATLGEFAEFAGCSQRDAKAAASAAGVEAFGDSSGLLGLPNAFGEFADFDPPAAPAYSLVASLDTFLLLRRGCAFWLDPEDPERTAPTEKGLRALGGLAELTSHAILDRGRLVGLWEFDAEEGRIVWHTWVRADDAMRAAIEATEAYIRGDLGDARSFSLDSPASRRPRLDALREMSRHERT